MEPRSGGPAGLALRLHRLLLPDRPYVGWVAYLWLVYLSLPLAELFDPRYPLERKAATALAVLAFLPLYFRVHWTRGRETLPYIVAMTALGAALGPLNRGASVFFIYAGSFAGYVGPARSGLKVIAAIEAVIAVESVALSLHPTFWVSGGLLTLIIGLVGIFYSELGRKNEALRASQEEVRRLGAIAERERIARDLHDLLGHTLSVITLKSELASRLVGRDAERAAAEIRDVERISRDALTQVRAAVAGYRSGGLSAELSNAKLALEAVDVAFRTDVALPPMPVATETVLSMVLREAVTNVIRHAAATRCEVTLRSEDGRVSLEVADDGRGGVFREGSGLAGMRERVVELGGSLEVKGDRGTRVTVRVPVGGAAAARGVA